MSGAGVRRLCAAAVLWLLAAGIATAQVPGGPAPTASPGCPTSGTDLPTQALFGRWEATFADLPGVATLQLGKHPEYDGVRGTVSRTGGAPGAAPQTAQLAGDIGDDGMLNLDESRDGHAISGVWLGQLQPDSCGKVFKGVWRDAASDTVHDFVLTRTGDDQGHP